MIGRVIAFVLMVSSLAAAQSATARPATQPTTRMAAKTGAFHIAFTDQSPLSPIEAQNKRHHIKVEAIQRYNLTEESFEAFVPEDYDGKTKFGILVWVNAGGRGNMPRGWQELLSSHHLIGIGANQSGNERGIGVRFGLALDGVHNLKKIYSIDEQRVYVSGISGGGKVASMLPIIYPEVFHGAIPICGVSWYQNIPVPGETNKVYPRNFDRPPTITFDKAKLGRFVLITGSNDMNRDPTQATYELGFKKDGFKNVEYVEVPGMGHQIPDTDVIEKAIASIDAPWPAPPTPKKPGSSAAKPASPAR
ncbi:MAG TPA: PHB depolymerase family esterase [Tepidisphaeraceae bacterium]|jgi:predicted esterase